MCLFFYAPDVSVHYKTMLYVSCYTVLLSCFTLDVSVPCMAVLCVYINTNGIYHSLLFVFNVNP